MNLKQRLRWTEKSHLIEVFFLFMAANILHFCILIIVEFYFSSVSRPFHLDWYSLLIGFANGLCFNSLVAAVLVYLQLVGLNTHAIQWFRASRLLCIVLPSAPIFDFFLHFTGTKAYAGFKNRFSSDISLWNRVQDVIVPGNSLDVVDIPLGHRVMFILLSLINAGYVLKQTGSLVRSGAVLVISYFSICLMIGVLSPSDVQPITVLQNLIVLPILAWCANLYLIYKLNKTIQPQPT